MPREYNSSSDCYYSRPSHTPSYGSQGCSYNSHRTQSASGLTVSGYGRTLYVLDGDSVTRTSVLNGGTVVVGYGGSSGSATVSNNGLQAVINGGTSSGTTVKSGGIEVVYAGGRTSQTVLTGGDQVVYGGTATNTTVGNGSTQYVLTGLANGTAIKSGGAAAVSSWGTISNASVYSGGELIVNYGSVVQNTKLYTGSTLDLNFLRYSNYATATISNDYLVITSNHTKISFKLADNYSGYKNQTVTLSRDNDGSTLLHLQEVCFLPGTLIATPVGERAVETFEIGDSVLTPNGETRTITWVGRAHARVRAGVPDDQAGYPVRILANAIADGVPHADLLVTGEHCLFLNGGFTPARMLVNGASIIWDYSITAYDYLHVETDGHSVILANGLMTESYLDTGNRHSFTQSGRVVAFGGAPASWAHDAAAELVTDRARVEPIWMAIAARAGVATTKTATTTDAALRLELPCGTLLTPRRIVNDRAVFSLPDGVSDVRIISRTSRPCDMVGPFLDDRRNLGVLVGNVTLFESASTRQITTHLTTQAEGWYSPDAASMRWTAGNAVLNINTMTAAVLTLQIVTAGPYSLEDDFAPLALSA
ncbi:Hint domain-containing protein [Gluconobacter sp. Dm-62]|uniref:Hint domain-containing protein n=1 Tax=Gluconobacter sp. Dm-62 TaxID=2799804 RepID=UPI001B8C6A12|nr:Hint domain-containing protein [Gluconobacter sp. Dm-62]MBS1103102.1 Hint domain-containing protein [Gluconobacter sp. Dm-62]